MCKSIYTIYNEFRYLFLANFRVFQLNTLIRSKLNLNKAEAVYLFVNSKVALRGGIVL